MPQRTAFTRRRLLCDAVTIVGAVAAGVVPHQVFARQRGDAGSGKTAVDNTLALARAVLKRATHELGNAERRSYRAELGQRLHIATEYLGRGYGFATTAGEMATTLAAEQGLVLEPTYTAKAFAAALDRVTEGGFKRVLFWHTFSSAPVQPLLAGAPSAAELPATLRALLVRTACPTW